MSVNFTELRESVVSRYLELKACGANKPGGGGFSTGNTCARGGGGGGITNIEVSVEKKPSGKIQLSSNNGSMKLTPEGEENLRIVSVFVDAESRGQGEGKALYNKAIEVAKGENKNLLSDISVESAAIRIWESLERRGYNINRNPNVVKAKTGALRLKDKNSREPIFQLKLRQT